MKWKKLCCRHSPSRTSSSSSSATFDGESQQYLKIVQYVCGRCKRELFNKPLLCLLCLLCLLYALLR